MQAMNRVGCMPCIMCKKSELREIASRFPGHVDRIAEWETLVSEISKRGATTFFDITSDPVAAETFDGVAHGAEKRHGIRNAVEWSKTSRGGRQYDMKLDADEAFGTACNTWGACE